MEKQRYEFRYIRQEEADQAADIEQICFPPNEACARDKMKARIETAPELFLVAVDRETGRLAGFLNGLSTDEERFRDEFFLDASLYRPQGSRVMLLGLDVLPEHRGQGLARRLVEEYERTEAKKGRRALVLTCLEEKVAMYQRLGFEDLGLAGSSWGGEVWHEMSLVLKPCPLSRQKGRPQRAHGRLPKELRVYDFLDSLGISYERIDHEVTMTMEACAAVDEALEAVICKNLFLCNRQETSFYLLMMPGEKKFKTKELSGQLGVARLSFASETYMERFLDITPGSVSVLGLMNDKEGRVQLVIDEDVRQGEFFGCHPCINTSSLRLRTSDLLEKILPALGHEPVFVTLVGED